MEKRLTMAVASLLLSTGVALAQTAVTGTVVSKDDGQPVIGATVQVIGANTGAVTDVDGKFSITMPAGKKNLRISYVGMVTKDIQARNGMEIVLLPETKDLDEVLVVAYGSQKRSSLTGAVSQIDSKDIEKTISTSVTAALEGSAPGVQVNNTYGEPGAEPTIRIRGFGSVNGSNSPLYVLDGVPFTGSIADLNSNDIESITVLKDAASAALFGSRAANGVILITTKKAKGEVKPTLTFTTNHGAYTRGIGEYDRLDADRWMEAEWTGMKNYAKSLSSLNYNDADAAAYATSHLIGDLVRRNIYDAADDQLFDANGKLTAKRLAGYDDLDWQDALEKTGYRQEYNLSYTVSGDKYNLFASAGYLKENGYIINTGFERYSGRVNSTFTPVKWFKGGVNLAVTSQDHNYNETAYGSYYANPFYASRYMAPVYPIYSHNADGSIVRDENGDKVFDTTSSYLKNRHIVFERLTDVERNERLTADLQAFGTIILPYGFDITVKGAKNFISRKHWSYNNPEIGDGAANGGRYTNYDYRYTTTNFQQQLNWAQDYGVHHVDVLLGHESYQLKSNVVYGMNTQMSIAGNMVMSNFTKNSYLYGSSDEDATESYLARARYNYDGKYFFEASFRADGSSRFHPDNRWGNFFSFGGAWDITKEKFMKDVKWVDYLKLRASYGEVGNNFVNDGQGNANYYAYQALYYLDKNGGNGSLVKQSLAADKVKWETTQTVDVALDANLFDRLELSIGYFDKKSKDLLFAIPLPSSAGAFIWQETGINLTQLSNIGSVTNRGWELSANVNLIKNKNFKWNFGADATFLSNKIQKLPNHEDIANGSLRRFSEGHSIYEFYTYHFVGVDQMTGNSLYTLSTDEATIADAKSAGAVVTINGVDYTTDTNYGQRDWAGSAIPDVYGSFHTDASWKGLSLNVLFTYSLGGKIYDSSYQDLMTSAAASASALHTDVLKSWSGVPAGMTETSANRIAPKGIPVLDNNLAEYNNAISDRWLTSASYLVLKNITLSYSLPQNLVTSWGIQGVTFNCGIENAFTLTSRKGLNPQYSYTGGTDDTYTTARIFNIGASIKF